MKMLLPLIVATCCIVPTAAQAEVVLHNDDEVKHKILLDCGEDGRAYYSVDRHEFVRIPLEEYGQQGKCFIKALIDTLQTPEYLVYDGDEVFLKYGGIFSKTAG